MRRPWDVIRPHLGRGSLTGIGDGLANCFIIGSTINLKMYCYSIKGKPYSLYGVEQSGMKARRVLLQNRSFGIYSWLWIKCFESEVSPFPVKKKSPMVLSCFSTKPWANSLKYCLGLLTEEGAFIDNLLVLAWWKSRSYHSCRNNGIWNCSWSPCSGEHIRRCLLGS